MFEHCLNCLDVFPRVPLFAVQVRTVFCLFVEAALFIQTFLRRGPHMVTFHLITSQDLAPVVSSVLVKVLPALATQLKVHSSTTLQSRIKSFLPELHCFYNRT